MPTETANYGFTKDNEDEFYNVNVVNNNLDKIDTEMKRIENAIPIITPTDSVKWLGTVAGTANALTVTHAAITSYSDGLGVSFAANANSSAAMTLNINSLGAIPIKKANGTAFSNAKANGVYTVRYRAGAFILQGESEVEVGKQIITPSTVNQAITQGVHDGTGYVLGSPNLLPQNIKNGVTMFGVTGTLNSEMADRHVQYVGNGVPTSPVVVPKSQPFLTITGDGYRMFEWYPYGGSTFSNILNGGLLSALATTLVQAKPFYSSNSTLRMVINTAQGSFTHTFPINKYNKVYFPFISVVHTGTQLLVYGCYFYDDANTDRARAEQFFAPLSSSLTTPITNIQFYVNWGEVQVQETESYLYGAVYKTR